MNAVAGALGAMAGAMAANVLPGIIAGAAGAKRWLWFWVVTACWIGLVVAILPLDSRFFVDVPIQSGAFLIDALLIRAGLLALKRWRDRPA